MAVATARFRLSSCPAIGILTRVVQTAANVSDNPGRLLRNRTPAISGPPDLMRHSWYRRRMQAKIDALEIADGNLQ